MALLTLLFLGAYLAAVLAIGFFWRRRAGRDEASYFAADRSLTTFWGFVGLASLTTGGSTTIALAAFVYTHGLAGIWLDLAGALGLLLLGLFLAARIRREGAITLPEIIGRYYGRIARRAAALLVLASEIAWFALLVTATQLVLTSALGVSALPAIVGATAVFVAYTSLGGHFAVVRTDLLQYGLMVVGILGVALVSALTGSGGLDGLPPEAWRFPTAPTLGAGDVAALLVLVGLPHLIGSDITLKLLSCRDEGTARRAALLAAVSKVAFGGAVAAIALAARKALAPLDPERALPEAILAFAPPALAALVVVSLVATMQTSADTVLLSAAAVTVRDLAPPGRPDAAIRTARLLAPIYGALGLLVALALDRKIVDVLKLGYSIFAAGLILPVLFALLPGRFRPQPAGAIAAMIGGGTVAAIGRFLPEIVRGRDPVLAGTAVNLALLLASFLLPRRPEPGRREAAV
ncbi:MAG: sodium:solute symporter [Thermoanaerobaculia bacterium]